MPYPGQQDACREMRCEAAYVRSAEDTLEFPEILWSFQKTGPLYGPQIGKACILSRALILRHPKRTPMYRTSHVTGCRGVAPAVQPAS